MAIAIDLAVEERIFQLVHHFGLAKAHFAAREFQEFGGLARVHPEILASLTLVCPPRTLKTDALQPLGSRLLCFYGRKGPNAAIVEKSLAAIPDATQVRFENYLDVNWSDVVADHADAIGDALLKFLPMDRHSNELPPCGFVAEARRMGRHFLSRLRIEASAHPAAARFGAVSMGAAAAPA